ncbi:MAG TPA: hypothetical protein VFH46_03535, partial [Pyrinomonadaceae bacterium]|nr:hypothetical protein [Pyrinomonadaceae bacterium]
MKASRNISRVFFLTILLCLSPLVAHAQATITKTSFGKTDSGENIDLYTLRNGKVEAAITNYGGI